MRAVTAGEHLYLLVRNEILGGDSRAHEWRNALPMVSADDDFIAYLNGAAAVFTTRRLLRHWSDERWSVPNESQHVRKVMTFAKTEIFPRIDEETCRRLARAVIGAHQASGRKIPDGCRRSVLRERLQHSCYLCGQLLSPQAPRGDRAHLTLEHIWPASMGGDSIEENLLPACSDCQHDTQDALSWEWANIHNLVLPAAPSDDALQSVNRRIRYARHYFQILRSVEHRGLSLKEAFLRIGPIRSPITHVHTGLPVTFFDLQTH